MFIFTHKQNRLKFVYDRRINIFIALAGLMLFFVAGLTHAQVLVANDDSFGIPFVSDYDPPFLIESGVLENDTIDDESALDNAGTTVELVSDVTYGALSCPDGSPDGIPGLCADGSFSYKPKTTLDEPDTPGPRFSGFDSFTYQFVVDAEVSATATVTLTACTGGPQVFTCWQELSYRDKLAEMGYGFFREGFEGAAWDTVRSPPVGETNTAPEIISQGIIWTTNDPLTNEISTVEGAAFSGLWGVYDPKHGSATGTETECNVDTPPEHCLYHDGVSGSILPGGTSLHGVGGYITGYIGSNIAIIIDGVSSGGLGKLPDSGYYFFGVIDTRANGFSNFEFRELDSKVGQKLLIWADDFIITTTDMVCTSCILYLLL